ncbi:MAG: ABC transporter permease [Chloroflexi bacterium]|nr:ABC transporter permease [Chloroflexota bacterium]
MIRANQEKAKIPALERYQGRSPGKEAWRRFRQKKVAMVSLGFILALFFMGVLAPWIAPYGYSDQNLAIAQQAPSSAHWLGTDSFGRDLLSRIIWGSRTAFVVSTMVVSVATVIGLILGSLAGFLGRWVDNVIMRICDLLFAFPGMLFAIFIAATVKPNVVEAVKNLGAAIGLPELARSGMVDYLVVLLALAMVGWPGMARLVRGQILSLKEKEYVEAARALGASPMRIILRHLLPNTLNVILVVVSMAMGGVIMAESILSFVGIGIQPPNPSWGAMIEEDYGFWRTHPHLVFVPGGLLAAVIFAFNFLGDGLNDALNPRTR